MGVPKFRAWHKPMQRMSEVLAISYERQKVKIRHLRGTTHMTVLFDDVELMQSTGLVDKNGQEVFEGDIVVAMSQGVKVIGEVKRRIDGYWLMYPAWQHGEFWHIVKNVDTGETGVEVIGNVYEHNRLLK